MKKNLNTTVIAWGILIVLAIIWGSSFILMKWGLMYFSHFEVGALRISIAFLFLSLFSFSRFKKIKSSHILWLILSGFIGNFLPAFLFAYAQTGIDSSLAGILNSLTPLFTLLVGLSFFSLKTRWLNILGVLIALIGAVGLISVSGGNTFEFNFKYSVFVILATVCYAFNVNILKSKLNDIDPVSITVFAILLTALPAVIYLLFFTGFVQTVSTNPESWKGLGYIAILAIVGTALALMVFNKLIQMTSAVFSSSVTYLIPIVALFFGIRDGEKFEWYYLIWISLILVGVFLVNSGNRGSKKK